MHPVSNSKREFPISDRRVDENLEHFIRDAVKDDRAVIYPFQVVDFALDSSSRINTVSYSSTRGTDNSSANSPRSTGCQMRLPNGSALLRLGHRYRA